MFVMRPAAATICVVFASVGSDITDMSFVWSSIDELVVSDKTAD